MGLSSFVKRATNQVTAEASRFTGSKTAALVTPYLSASLAIAGDKGAQASLAQTWGRYASPFISAASPTAGAAVTSLTQAWTPAPNPDPGSQTTVTSEGGGSPFYAPPTGGGGFLSSSAAPWIIGGGVILAALVVVLVVRRQ